MKNKFRVYATRCVCMFVCCLTTVCVWSQETEKAETPDIEAFQEQKIVASSNRLIDRHRDYATKTWEVAIRQLERRDARRDPADGILFIGSSSIRLWRNIETDMAPYKPIQRGYGGARYSDLAVFAERLIRPHQYRAMVMFVANDVIGREYDNAPEHVAGLVRYIVDVSHEHQRGAPVLLVEVTPTESRFAVWGKIRDVNARLREIALTTPNTYFVATAEHFMDPTGKPRSELFVEDKLHFNNAGYDVWGNLIRRRLDDVFRTVAEFHAIKARRERQAAKAAAEAAATDAR